MAPITRTLALDDLTPTELATLFADMGSDEQAQFFNALKPITDVYGGLGWCGQCAYLKDDLDAGGRDVLATLAGHAFDLDIAA